MKRNAIAIATATLCALGFSAAAHAQVSGDTIKIGFISDMSGVYSDVDGLGGAEAIKMAIADAGVVLAGKKVEFISADHQNKADIAASKAREWFDQQGVDMLIGGTNSGASLAMAKVAAEKKKIFIAIGAGSSRLTNEECTPYTVHYAYDTVALARGTGGTIVKQGGKNWYFMTADYAFGHSLEKDTAEVVKAAGGKVLGSVKHPLGASDFSSFLLQAQSSKPQILGLANAGGDAINSIKAANEFGLTKSMKLAGLLIFINDIHSLGLNLTQGMYLTDGWYWDLNPETRAWSKRYFAKMKKEPSMLQAADYSAAANYLKAVKALGTDDTEKVMAYLKKTKINDMFTQNGEVRPDGRMVHDMYLMEVKKPAESKYPWDYYKVVATVPGAQAYVTKAESKCSLWK
ncbi:ABC transporter substrate-binding protein [Janthinobacterium lividum]|uniref:ABC transporter substrate-binding protein n=1 Tax=Janthinobacterium lividum TaxID=29581 RepID=UPI0008748E9F|nr:ABC transporter substrate-binding protein [Janthinobacterium lividum]MCC7714974.1 ABC transporter substrate-binding protein [Janthinobacterium lividum]OEZ54370.1 receptor family ligand binding region [Janthinobacterium lividum]WQE29131.1 ABC transporter substrate-binding protein [Janthinobacterium lividum]STQ94602.1 leucine ABC transporter subunit substrate-binding protein LivK [Janthinobacterium lividum]